MKLLKMLKICHILLMICSEVIDSRGNPTVEVEVYTDSGAFGRVYHQVHQLGNEAVELRDNDKGRFW